MKYSDKEFSELSLLEMEEAIFRLLNEEEERK